ncbi:NUDIX domain-containing protein [Hyphomicrobium sp.]|uniref:NUDIX domain-containing protein n=1 Tax=Hyphomicrobium sp. TaxID=82 RepID=UPI0035617198
MREDIPLVGRWIARAFQKYWRVVRGLRLAVDACVVDEAGRILMVRNESGGSWELPGGAVQKDENLETGLRRVLRSAAGIEVNGKPELSFFYAPDKSGQTGVYVVRHWRPHPGPAPRKTSFFHTARLPSGICPLAAERIRRSLRDRTASEV